jgi:hypothetical protein
VVTRKRSSIAGTAATLLVVPLAACTIRSLDYLTDGSGSSGPGDASADRAADSGLANGTWCEQHAAAAALCMDFEEGALTKGYSAGTGVFVVGPTADPGSTATLGAPALSPPGAFVASVSALDGGASAAVQYQQPYQIAGSVQSLHLRFDMLLAVLTAAQEIDFVTLYLPNPDGGAAYRTYLTIQSGQGQLYTDQGMSADFPFPADGKWHDYRLDLTLGQSLSFDLYVDDPDGGGAPAAHITETAPFGASAQSSFALGISAYGPSGSVRANIDNVVFEAP